MRRTIRPLISAAQDTTYKWANAFAKIDDLNTAAFAGFPDWRLPNESELETLVVDLAAPPSLGTLPSAPPSCSDSC